MKLVKNAVAAAVTATLVAGTAMADGHATTKLRIQTYHAPETTAGKLDSGLFDSTETLSNGEIHIIDGADASNVAKNKGLGLCDITKIANHPGFHSMPPDHLACNKAVWDGTPKHHRTIMKGAMADAALKAVLFVEKHNTEALSALKTEGIEIAAWSDKELQELRHVAQATWPEFAITPEAQALVDSHLAYLNELGIDQK